MCGSRTWRDRPRVRAALRDINQRFPKPTVVVGYNVRTKQPRGADQIIYQEANRQRLHVETVPAQWERYGKSAGFIRNHKMASLGAVLCVAFWDGESSGTKNMMEQAEKFDIPVEVHRQ